MSDAAYEMTPHRREACERMSPLGRRFFGLVEFDDNEEFLMEVRKHPFGLLLIEVGGFLLALIVALIPIFLAFNLSYFQIDTGASSGSVKGILIMAGLILAILTFIGTAITAILYRNNVIYITNEKVAQVLYISILSRKVSQLGIGEVQDTTVSQNGIFPRLFGYGTLVIETAGEQDNYIFTYLPNPYAVSRTIISAHEENVHKYGN